MTAWVRQSTAVEVKLGPFVDSGDGVTAETALTITQAEVLLAKNGGDFAQKTETTSLVHESNGFYRCLLDTTDTNTLGILYLQIAESGALPIWRQYMVVPTNVWDSLFGSDLLDVSVTQWLGTAVATPGTAGTPSVDITRIANAAVSTTTAQLGVNAVQISGDGTAADNAESFFDGTGYAGTNNVIPVVTTTTNVTTVNGLAANVVTAAAIATDAIGAAEIADGAITAATFAANAINAAALDPDVTTELQAGLATAAALDVVDNFVDTELGAVKTVVDAILVDTGTDGVIVASHTTAAKAEINAEVLDVLNVDTFAELTDVPAATSSLKDKITWLFMLARNRVNQTATVGTIYADNATTALSTTTVSDDGTTFERGEWTP